MTLISLYYDFNSRLKANEPMSQRELVKAFNDFTKELTLWGSAKAIRAWGEWRANRLMEILIPKVSSLA